MRRLSGQGVEGEQAESSKTLVTLCDPYLSALEAFAYMRYTNPHILYFIQEAWVVVGH